MYTGIVYKPSRRNPRKLVLVHETAPCHDNDTGSAKDIATRKASAVAKPGEQIFVMKMTRGE